MRRLAHRCGYTAPTIYHHFGDKQGLIDAVAAARIETVLARVRRVRRREDPLDTLRAMLLEFARLQDGHTDDDLGDWIAARVAFPNSMVDRITPATTADDR